MELLQRIIVKNTHFPGQGNIIPKEKEILLALESLSKRWGSVIIRQGVKYQLAENIEDSSYLNIV